MAAVEQLITDNLDIWSSAVKAKSAVGRGSKKKLDLYGIKKLRELILELAVRGLLVPQDVNDEPASKFLERIALEKAKLVRDGKVKKQKQLLLIEEGYKLFKIPENWAWQYLGEIGTIFNGNSINASEKKNKYTNINGTPFIATKDVGYGFEKLDYNNGVAIPVGEEKFKLAKEGSVLICAEGGSAGKKCGIAEQDIFFGNKLFANVLYGSIEPKFILSLYLTPSFFEKFSESMTGIIGGISSAKFMALPAPIPPLNEQHRIVVKVDELMALCDQLEQQAETSISTHQTLVRTLLGALTNASERDGFNEAWSRIAEHFDTLFTTEWSIEQLKQTILQLAVAGIIIPFGEEVKDYSLKDLLDFGPRNGFSPKEADYETEIKVLKLGATSYGQLDLEQSKFIDEDIPSDSHLFLKAGDILIQRGNSADYVGSNVLVRKNLHNIIYPDLMMKLIANELVESEFLSIALMAPSSRNFMWSRMTGTSGTMPKISKKIVESIPITVPSNLSIQIKTVNKVNELMSLCDTLIAQINTAQSTQLQLADTLASQAVA